MSKFVDEEIEKRAGSPELLTYMAEELNLKSREFAIFMRITPVCQTEEIIKYFLAMEPAKDIVEQVIPKVRTRKLKTLLREYLL